LGKVGHGSLEDERKKKVARRGKSHQEETTKVGGVEGDGGERQKRSMVFK